MSCYCQFFLSVYCLFFSCSHLFSFQPSRRNLPIKDIVVFGDSLSDQGNFFNIISSLPMVSPVHFPSPPAGHEGKAFCDGKLLVECLAERYGISLKPAWAKYNFLPFNTSYSSKNVSHINRDIASMCLKNFRDTMPYTRPTLKTPDSPLTTKDIAKNHWEALRRHTKFFLKPDGTNYSIAGACIGQYNTFFIDNFCLENQVMNYINRNGEGNCEHTLFVIFIGGNDIFQILRAIDLKNIDTGRIVKKIDALAKNLMQNVQKLLLFGAKKILIIPSSVPSFLPCYSKSPEGVCIGVETISRFYETLLEKELALCLFEKNEVFLLPILDHFTAVSQVWPEDILHSAPLKIEFSLKDILSYTRKSPKIKVTFNKGFNQRGFDEGRYPFFDSIHLSEASNKLLFERIAPDIDKFLSL